MAHNWQKIVCYNSSALANSLISDQDGKMAKDNRARTSHPRRVVITGIGCLTPIGNSKEEFWSGLRRGASGVDRIRAFEPDGIASQIAGEVKGFDPNSVLTAKDRQHVPRVVPLALGAARQAIADAGLSPSDMSLDERRRIGVVLGTGGGGLEFAERQYYYYYSGLHKKASVYTIPSSTIGTLSSELSMAFGLHGFSHVISTGCTSSTDALGYSTQNIMLNRADIVIAGGVDAPIAPGIMAAFCLMEVLTFSWNHEPQRGSRPFSKDRDGFVLGEGAWIFILEEMEHALERGAHIYAEIAGYGSTCDAYHRVRLNESGEEPARAMRLAIEEAGLDIEDIDYVNLHGTSTELNDRIETRAVKLCFGKRAYQIPMSATKSMIGHPQGASGAAGIAATLFAMEQGLVPPTINLDQPDPECDLDYVPNSARKADVRVALCNCIGFGSKNAAIVLKRMASVATFDVQRSTFNG